MNQLRLIDDRILKVTEEKECFVVLNGDEVYIQGKGRLYSFGKKMRNWDKFDNEDVDIKLTDEETKKEFIIECCKDFEMTPDQIVWVKPEEVQKENEVVTLI